MRDPGGRRNSTCDACGNNGDTVIWSEDHHADVCWWCWNTDPMIVAVAIARRQREQTTDEPGGRP